jgi:hypothetical protein
VACAVTGEQTGFPFAQTAARLTQASATLRGKGTPYQESEVFLITSLSEFTPLEMLQTKRDYWFIEGSAHQMLDGSYLQEDKSRVRHRNSAQNLGMFRRVAVSVGNQWIRRQSNPRKATLNSFFDEMRRRNSATPWRMATCEHASWLP